MANFMKEVEVLETYFENADTNALKDALSFDEAGSTNEEAGNTGLLVRINNFIQGVIERIHQMYRELRAKLQAKLVTSKLSLLKEKTAYTVFQTTKNTQLALQARKLMKLQDDGLKEIYSIYAKALSGRLPHQTAVMQAKVVAQDSMKKMEKVTSGMALTTMSKSNTKRALYKAEIKRLLETQQEEHNRMTKNLEDQIIAFEKKISSEAGAFGALKKEHMGLTNTIASLGSKLNRCAAHQTAKLMITVSNSLLRVAVESI